MSAASNENRQPNNHSPSASIGIIENLLCSKKEKAEKRHHGKAALENQGIVFITYVTFYYVYLNIWMKHKIRKK